MAYGEQAHRWVRVAPWALAPVSLAMTLVSPALSGVANVATVVLLAWLLMRSSRRRDAVARTRRFLLLALAAAFVASVLTLAYQLATGASAPPRPWFNDPVALCYVPLTITGLVLIPMSSGRIGHRVRAIADGALAASSLWFLLAGTVSSEHSQVVVNGALGAVVRLAYPVGDVFVVATALTVLARCVAPARRMVGWTVAGLGVIAAQDIWLNLPGGAASQAGPMFVFQLGLLLLLGVVVAPAVVLREEDDASRLGWLLGALPFLPLVACIGVTTGIIVRGEDLPHAKALPALVIALALVGRQFVGARDKQRLLMELSERERFLEGALRRDALTGLANRLGLTERLDALFGGPDRCVVTLGIVDLNEFKLINDNHGHQTGDQVIRAVASRLENAVRQSDLVARLGGDEFAVVAPRLPQRQRARFVARLRECFDEPIAADGRVFDVSASIGIVTGGPPDTPATLLAHADAAMYEAKSDRTSRSPVVVLSDDARALTTTRLRIREEIAHPQLAEFSVVYQPIVDLATGRVRGIEALMRWRHPELGNIPPDLFIPLAEQAGTIGILGAEVLRTAVSDLARLREMRPDHRLAVGVNASPRQFADPTFGQLVLDLLHEHDVMPDQLVLEITEQAFEANLDPVAATLRRLAEAGVSVAVDDFGTGYSSLRYLQQLPLEVLKIDRDFVADLTAAATPHHLVPALTTMAQSLGLQVVAEGIETLDQLRALQLMNCELGQGYLFSAPMPIEDIEQLVRTGHSYPVGTGDAAPLAPAPNVA